MKAYIIVFGIGILEGILIKRAKGTGKKIIFSHFSFYHVLLGIFLWYINYALLQWYPAIFLFIIIQDMASHLASWSWPKDGDWITWPTYKTVLGLPVAYWFLILAFFISIAVDNYINLLKVFQ